MNKKNKGYRHLNGLPLVAQPELQETLFRSLAQEGSLEEEMATHLVFLPGEFHGQRSLEGCNPWGHRVERDCVTNTHTHTHTRTYT